MDKKKAVPAEVVNNGRHTLNYDKLKEIMVQNVNRSRSKTFTQYTKELIKQYLKNPYSNSNNIRQVSSFLVRNSMIYKKIISYFSQMPLFYYNIIYRSDLSKGVDASKLLKSYNDVSSRLQEINMQKEFSTVIATALRDGVYYGFVYDGDGDGFFIQGLDPQYCKISGITGDGQYIISFNAAFFDAGNNLEYIKGVDGNTDGVWDDVFNTGYDTYKSQGRDFMWFELPAEKTLCLLAGDDAEMPLPYFLPVFTSLLDLLDLEQILASKTELENYVLLVSKIPLLTNTGEVDDFAVSLELVEYIQNMIDAVVPDLVGTAYSPCDLDVVNFNKANSPEETNKLAQSMNNLFSNLGISKLVVSSGESTNSVGLRQSILNDESLALKYVDCLSSWMNAYIKANYSSDFIFKFHRVTYFSHDDFIKRLKECATFGLPVATDLATSLGQTPYEMMCATSMENTLGIKDGLWKPLSTSYTQTDSGNENGRPQSDDKDLTDEGAKTRDGEKNKTTKAGK